MNNSDYFQKKCKNATLNKTAKANFKWLTFAFDNFQMLISIWQFPDDNSRWMTYPPSPSPFSMLSRKIIIEVIYLSKILREKKSCMEEK